jgi:hypothetical protein
MSTAVKRLELETDLQLLHLTPKGIFTSLEVKWHLYQTDKKRGKGTPVS